MRENKLADRDAAKNIGFRGENLCGGISEKQRIRNFGEKIFVLPVRNMRRVDIIAVTGNYLVFLEVKCRRYNGLVFGCLRAEPGAAAADSRSGSGIPVPASDPSSASVSM